MNLIVPLGFLDTFELAASLRPRLYLLGKAEEHGRRVLDLRWPEDPEAETPVWKAHPQTRKWPELSNTIGRIMRLGKTALPGIDLERGRILLEMLDPGAMMPWSMDESRYAQRFARLHYPLRTNPLAMVYAGTEGANLLIGQLTLVKRAAWSATNLSADWPRIHLIIDFRAKDQP